MQTVAQNWLVLELTNSPRMLGLDSFLGQIPIFLFSLIGGVVADRMDRRKLLISSQVVQMCCAFLLAALYAYSKVDILHILCLSFVVGFAQAFGGPAYQALIPTLVPPKDLPNAIALNSIQFNLARVVGPMVGGIAWTTLGVAWCFALNGMSFVAVIFSLSLLSFRPTLHKAGISMMESLKEGLRFVRERESMMALIVLAFSMTMLGIPLIVFLPVVVRDVFRLGPTTFTLLLCISGAGAVAGALLVAAFGNIKSRGKLTLLAIVALGILMAGFAVSKNLILSCILLFLAGAALIAVFAMISSLVQLIAPDEMRGRVMSVYNVAFRGGMPIGSIISGELITRTSVELVLAGNGILLAILGFYFLFVQRKVGRL